MTATSSARRPVARLSRPGEVAALVPLLCGFVPAESVVVVSLHGARSRVGLTMRVDLPPPGAEAGLVEQVLARLEHDGGRGALVVVFTSAPGGADALPRHALVDALGAAIQDRGLALTDALLVRAGRWWSYTCEDDACCPADGTPVDPSAGSATIGLVAAVQALDGRTVLASRSELVASLAPPSGTQAGAAADRLRAGEQTRIQRVAAEGRLRVGQDALRLWRHALERTATHPDGAEDSDVISPGAAAMLTVSLADVLVRDEVVTWALEDDATLLSLLLTLARGCPAPFDAGLSTIVAWVAHLRGDGALANVALDRALASDPGYATALLCRQALDGQVPPSKVRALLEESRRFLRELHPWTACHERP